MEAVDRRSQPGACLRVLLFAITVKYFGEWARPLEDVKAS
jgi:hypothetical protein